MLQQHSFAFAQLLSAVLSATVAVVSWRHRSATPAAAALTLSLVGVVIWAGGVGLAHAPLPAPLREAAMLANTVGGSIVVLGFFLQCRLMVDGNAVPSRRSWYLLSVEPVAVVLATATNGLHGMLYSELAASPPTGLTLRLGPLFWVHATYCYLLATWTFIGLGRSWRHTSDLQRRQLRTVLIGGLLPSIAGIPSLMMIMRGGTTDYSAIGFLLTGLLTWWAIFRQGMLRLVPVARALVLEQANDAVIVIDPAGTVLDANPAAVRLGRRATPDLPDDPVGHSYFDLLGRDPATGRAPVDGSYRLPLDGQVLDLDIRSSRLTDRRGNLVGHAVVVRDVTELSDRKRELTAVNGRLREQVATIERLRADLAEQTVRDVLTGLHNRRHLIRMIDHEVAEAAANGGGLGVVLMDVDHFKSVNDRHGHAAGDRLLVTIAQSLAENARPGDTVARYGGEEFVVLLPGTTMEQAWERAEEWRRRCAAVSGVTLSAGVAVFPDSGGSPEELLHAADKALYAAKAAGRDRVLTALPAGMNTAPTTGA